MSIHPFKNHESPTRLAIKMRQAAKSNSNRVHVIADLKGWVIKREGINRISKLYKTQAEAIRAAKDLIEKRQGSSLVVHKKDGTVRS